MLVGRCKVPNVMNRRAILAAIGSILAAGCSQNKRGGESRGAHKSGFGIGNSADTPVDFGLKGKNQSFEFNYGDDPKFDFNKSQGGSDITFDIAGEENNKRDSLPTPSETNERATEYLVQARRTLNEAIKIYAGFGGERIDITSVTPTTESFSQYQVKSKIDNAKQPLRKATEYATEGQKVYILALEQVGIFLKHTTNAEAELQTALSEYETSMNFFYDGDTMNFDAAQKRLRDHTARVQDEVDLIRSEADSTALQVIGSDAEKLYEAKLAQFEALIQTFRSLDQGISEIGDGLADLKKGTELYTDREYQDASFDLTSATTALSSGKRAFGTARGNGVLQSEIKPGLDFATVLYRIADDLTESAEAKTDNDDERYVEYRERAVAHLQSDDRTEYMSEINKIQW